MNLEKDEKSKKEKKRNSAQLPERQVVNYHLP